VAALRARCESFDRRVVAALISRKKQGKVAVARKAVLKTSIEVGLLALEEAYRAANATKRSASAYEAILAVLEKIEKKL